MDHQFEKEEFDVINPRPGYSTLCSVVLFLFPGYAEVSSL